MIGEVTLSVAARPLLTVPINALVTRGGASEVTIVAADNSVRFASVQLGRNLGAMMEVISGIGAADRVVGSPNGLLRDGDKVIVQP